MKLLPVALALFYRFSSDNTLEVWTQIREDDGIYHGLWEFPGGKIKTGEGPLAAVVREVKEEVGINVDPSTARFMGTYQNPQPDKNILLNVFLFPEQVSLRDKGVWLSITSHELSSPFKGQIPGPNHQIIDDLYRSLYS